MTEDRLSDSESANTSRIDRNALENLITGLVLIPGKGHLVLNVQTGFTSQFPEWNWEITRLFIPKGLLML
jgi:hypothetical protein